MCEFGGMSAVGNCSLLASVVLVPLIAAWLVLSTILVPDRRKAALLALGLLIVPVALVPVAAVAAFATAMAHQHSCPGILMHGVSTLLGVLALLAAFGCPVAAWHAAAADASPTPAGQARPKSAALRNVTWIWLGLLTLLIALPIAFMWRDWTQEQLNADLITMVRQNDSQRVSQLLRQGADPNARVKPVLSWWSLFINRLQGRSHLVTVGSPALLLAASAQAAPANRVADRPFSYGPTIHLLLQRGANPNVVDDQGETPLMLCAHAGDAGSVAELLAHGADVNATDAGGMQALEYATWGNSLESVLSLLAHGAQVDHKDNSGNNAVLGAADSNRMDILKVLVEAKANVRATNRAGTSALMLMVRHGNTAAVQMLLKHGADASAKDHMGRSSLYWLRNKPHSSLRQVLIQAGASR